MRACVCVCTLYFLAGTATKGADSHDCLGTRGDHERKKVRKERREDKKHGDSWSAVVAVSAWRCDAF